MDYIVLKVKNGKKNPIILDVLIDKEDERKLPSHVTAVKKKNGKYYCYVRIGYRQYTQLHRFLTDAPDGIEVDHINGNTQDNRKSNLRIAYGSINQFNKGPNKNNSLGIRNVYKIGKKFRVVVKFEGKKFDKYYDTLEEANKVAEDVRNDFIKGAQ